MPHLNDQGFSMRLLLVIAVLINFAHANEDCYRLLTQSYSADSYTYALSEFDIVSDYAPGTPEYAKAAVVALEKELGCDAEKDAIDSLYSVKCRKLVNELDYSRICFVRTSYGYYFVAIDMLGNVNVI